MVHAYGFVVMDAKGYLMSYNPRTHAKKSVTNFPVAADGASYQQVVETDMHRRKLPRRSNGSACSDWHWETDGQHRFTKLPGGITDKTMRALGEKIGKTRWHVERDRRYDAVWAQHRAQLDKHQTFRNFEYQREDEDGKPVVLCISGEPVVDYNGKFTGYRGIAIDITAHKQAEAELRVSEARFRTVVTALAEGVVLYDIDGCIANCNASAEGILGKSLAEMRGLSSVASDWEVLREDGSVMPEDEQPAVVARLTGSAQFNRIVCYRRPDLSILWTRTNVQPLFEGPSRMLTGFASSFTDITQSKRAEMEIVRLNVELENRVSRRTAQLELANKELEAFSYSVAHDLRSPLITIDGYCALLEKELTPEASERVRGFLTRIRKGVQRMGELTDGLLSLANLSRTNLRWGSVDMSAEVTKVIRQLSEGEPSRVLLATVEPDMVAHGDASLLREVLENLLANAWKFSSKKPQTRISVGSEIGADLQVTYFVQDNGAGFDMAYADKLFGAFERLHSPEEFAGSGIGLATVNRIITRHGGKIWAHSIVGEGSTFYFTLGVEETHLPEINANLTSMPLGIGPKVSLANGDHDSTLTDHQFTNAFEHSAIGMALVDLESRPIRVNASLCQMLGYSKAEMLSSGVRNINHPDDIEWDILQRNRALAGEIENYQWEKRCIHKAGHIVWGNLTCSLVRDTDRKPLLFILQIQDMTERKAAEQALLEREERFRALTELSSDWFWEQDVNFRFVEVIGEAADTVKFARQDVTGMARWELDHTTMEESVWLAHKAQLERHEVFRDFEITLLDSNGELRYESISGVPIFDAMGCFTGYRGTGRDITEIRQISDALRVSESQLRQITDAVPALIAYVDANQCYGFHNRAYEEAFGLSKDEIDGKTVQDVMGDELYEKVRLRVSEVLSGYPVVYERTQQNARGENRDYVVQYFPRYGDGNEEDDVIGFYSLANDVTELKRIDRMKSEFVSTVSHELRTPLTSIRGSLGLISGGAAGPLPDAMKNLVAIAKNNCERLIRLINDMLDIDKIESGKMRLELQEIELKPLLIQALEANEGFAGTKSVSLRLDCSDEPISVNVDSDRLMQVMTNLLSNAINYSPAGGVVEVHLLRAGAGVRVEIKDKGPGIPEEFHHRIFQKFSQADSSDTRQKEGTGLGLNISRAIVACFGGSIGFNTEAGVGTTFFFELPECRGLCAPVVRSERRVSGRPAVLVCEDDHDIARLIGMMLDKGGFDTDTAYSAEQALELLETSSYAAMTVDLNLPDRDGAALIDRLRSQPSTADMPIIVVSAMVEEGRLQLSHNPLTVSDWLEKPIDENRLIRGLQRAVARMEGLKPRILHVEDDPDIQQIAAAIVQEFADTECASTLEDARGRLREQHFDLILLDLKLGNHSGWDLVPDIDALYTRPPVIIFSAEEVIPPEGRQVEAVLVKTCTSNAELLNTIKRILYTPKDCAPHAPLMFIRN